MNRRNLKTQVWPGAVAERTLSDGSFVYDVVLSDAGEQIVLHAADEKAAYALLDAIREHIVGFRVGV